MTAAPPLVEFDPIFGIPTAVYRLYDAARRLLYVGIAKDVGKRLTGHARQEPWWGEVVYASAQLWPDRKAAAKAEDAAIKTENPVYNERGATPARRAQARACRLANPAFETAEQRRVRHLAWQMSGWSSC